MHDRTLAVSVWVSLALHIFGVALVPGPGVAAPLRVAVELEWIPDEPSAPLPPHAEPDPDTTLEEVAPPPLASDPADTTAAEVGRLDPPVEPAASGVAEEVPAPPEAEGPALPTEVEEPVESTLAAAETGGPDPERIAALLGETAAKVRGRAEEERYRFLEVRERVQGALERVHPGSHLVERDAARYRFLLRFRVDGEGYIHDLRLGLPPGSRIDARAIERAIASVNPLTPPPSSLALPIEFEWHVDFLE